MMSEVITDDPVTTEVTEEKVGHMRRFSDGNFDIPSHITKVQPHYLSASSGSCHDLCKYGIKCDAETKGRRLSLQRYAETSNKSQDLLRRVTDPVQRKQKCAITYINLPDINSGTPNNCDDIKKGMPESSKKLPASLRRQSSSPAELRFASEKLLRGLKAKTSSLPASRQLSRRHSDIILPNETLKMCSHGSNKTSSLINSREAMGASAQHSVAIKPKPFQSKSTQVSSPRKLSRRHSEAIIAKGSGIRQMSSSGGSRIRRNNDMKLSEEISASSKYATESNQKVRIAKSPSSSPRRQLNRRHSDIIIPSDLGQLHESSVGSGKRNSVKKMSKEMGTPNMGKKISLVPERVTGSPVSSARQTLSTPVEFIKNLKESASTKKIQKSVRKLEDKHPNDDNVLEKTLYVVEPLSENQVVEEKGIRNYESGVQANQSPYMESILYNHSHSPSSVSESPTSLSPNTIHRQDSFLESSESETESQKTDLKVERRRPRNVGVISSEDRDLSSQKLIFKSGTTVDVQHENRSPSRLKFKKRVLADSQHVKSDITGRSLRRLVSDGALYETKVEPMKVILKHQDMEERKDTRSLFNNVIEETASKLVQSRKSKVKALVGAFETLISRHDTKSSENTSTE